MIQKAESGGVLGRGHGREGGKGREKDGQRHKAKGHLLREEGPGGSLPGACCAGQGHFLVAMVT